jgi:hypothetical protein
VRDCWALRGVSVAGFVEASVDVDALLSARSALGLWSTFGGIVGGFVGGNGVPEVERVTVPIPSRVLDSFAKSALQMLFIDDDSVPGA